MARTDEGWEKARPIKEFHEAHKGEKYSEYMKLLHFVDVRHPAFHDLMLYVDDNGNYYEDSFYIGD